VKIKTLIESVGDTYTSMITKLRIQESFSLMYQPCRGTNVKFRPMIDEEITGHVSGPCASHIAQGSS